MANGRQRSEVEFDELRELCEMAGDKRSLAIGMTGLVMKHTLNARYAKRLALPQSILGCWKRSMTLS